MKLLITGALTGDEEFYSRLRELGFDLIFMQDERVTCDSLSIEQGGIEGVICNGLFLYNDIKAFSSLKFIQLTSAGLDRVPLDYIKEHGIKLFNARGVYSIPMAEYAICGVLQLYKKTDFFRNNAHERKWTKNREVLELFGKSVCIVGCGSVGTECAKRFKAFDCMVTGLDVFVTKNPVFDEIKLITDYREVFGKSDIVVLTLPLTAETEKFVDEEKLSAMKKGCVLVNISRGKVADEQAIAHALKNNLGGAVLDVFEEEPLSENSPLWTEENVIVTPHNSFIGDGNDKRLKEVILENLSNMG